MLVHERINFLREKENSIEVWGVFKPADKKPVPAQRKGRARPRNLDDVGNHVDGLVGPLLLEQLLLDGAYHPSLIRLINQFMLEPLFLLRLPPHFGIPG